MNLPHFDEFLINMEVQLVKSFRGADMLLVEGHTFYLQKVLKSGETFWRCTKKGCKTSVFTLLHGDQHLVSRLKGTHTHEADFNKVKRKLISNTCEKGAVDDIDERPLKIIREELQDELSETVTKKDIGNIRRNIYNERKKRSSGSRSADEEDNILKTLLINIYEDQSSAFHPQVDMKTEFEEIEIKSEPIDSLNDYLIDVDRDLKPSSDFDIPVNNSSDFSQEIVFKQEQIYESISDLPADPLQYIQPISTKNKEDMTAQSNLSSDAPTVDSNTNSAIFGDPYFKRVHKPLRLALSRFFPLETAMFREKFEDNEDLLFILTLLADIKCVNKVDRLDLKADVLNVVKRYRNK